MLHNMYTTSINSHKKHIILWKCRGSTHVSLLRIYKRDHATPPCL